MAKIVLCADIHFGVAGRLQDILWSTRVIREYCKAANIDTVIVLGDLFHDRRTIEIDVLSAAAKFFEGLDECYKRLEEEFTLLRFKNVEADDLMAYTVKKFEESDKYDKIWIISTDRDMCQMLSYTTSQFAYTSRKEYRMSSFYDQLGFDTPEEYAIFKAVTGDSGDNISTAAEDCGPKRTYAIIRGMTHITDLIDVLPIAGKQKYIQRLNAGEAKLLLNWELTNLREYCEVAINHPNPDNLKLVDEKLKCLIG